MLQLSLWLAGRVRRAVMTSMVTRCTGATQAMTRRRSRSPMRSPEAAAKQRAALRAFRELKHQAVPDGTR